jgi:hypothetical protein
LAYYFRTPVDPGSAFATALKSIEELPNLCGHVRCRADELYVVLDLSPEERSENLREFQTLILAAQTKHLLAYDISEIGADYWASCLDAATGANQDEVMSEATLATDVMVGNAEADGAVSKFSYYTVVGFDTPEGAAAFVKNFQDRDIIV